MEAQGVTEGGRVSRNLGYQDTTEKDPRAPAPAAGELAEEEGPGDRRAEGEPLGAAGRDAGVNICFGNRVS